MAKGKIVTWEDRDTKEVIYPQTVPSAIVDENGKTQSSWNKEVEDLNVTKQDTLISGQNIKTINGQSIVGGGDIEIVDEVDASLSDTSVNPVQNKVVKAALDAKLAYEVETPTQPTGEILYLRSDAQDLTNAQKTQVKKNIGLENEINEYNISALTGQTYTLQGAISALNAYLGGGARNIGTKVTFIDSTSNKAKTYTYFKMGSFVSVENWRDEPDGGYMRELCIAAGAIPTNDTVFPWELNGLKLTEEQISIAYNQTIDYSPLAGSSFAFRYQFTSFRTNFLRQCKKGILISIPNQQRYANDCDYMFSNNTEVEVIKLSDNDTALNNGFPIRSAVNMFRNCLRLVEVIGELYVNNLDGNMTQSFYGCQSLEKIRLHGVKTEIDFHWSLNFNIAEDGKTGLGFLLENTESSGFTITLANAIKDQVMASKWWGVAQEKGITIAFA